MLHATVAETSHYPDTYTYAEGKVLGDITNRHLPRGESVFKEKSERV